MWFKKTCKHQWRTLETIVVPPIKMTNVIGIQIEDLKQMAFGYTTIVLACSSCGEINKSIVNGQPT